MPSKKSARKKARPTGSQKMRAASGSTKSAAAAAAQTAIPKFVASLDKKKVIHDILIKGTPWPDIIKGKFTVKNQRAAADTLNSLLSIKNAEYKPIKLFPKGIPVIDEIRFEIEGKIKGGKK